MAYGEKVYKVRNGKPTKQFSWRARYKRPDGTWDSEPGFPTERMAEDWGADQEAAMRAGRWVDPKLARMLFGEWAREWMKAKQPRGNTVSTRWRLLETVILPKWEHTTLRELTWFDVEAWANAHSAHPTEVTHAVSLMSSILTGAVDKRHLLVNPLFGRRRSVASGTASESKRTRKKAGVKDYAEPEVVLQLAQRLGPVRGIHVLTTAFTGLRWGEGCGLHRDNTLLMREERYGAGVFRCPIIRIDPDVGELAEYEGRDENGKKLGTVLQLEPPKGEASERDIDIPPFLAILLRNHLQDWPWPYPFSPDSAGTFWRRGNWSKVLRPAVNGREGKPRRVGHAGQEAWAPIQPGLTMDLLRHTHDTYQDQIGVRPALMYEQAGHKRPGIKAVYQHPTPAMRQERLDGLQEIYTGALKSLGWTSLWGRVSLEKRESGNDLRYFSQMIIKNGDRDAA